MTIFKANGKKTTTWKMSDLKEYISKRMRMSHIYQPVMLKLLLEQGGVASKTQISKAILEHDFSQVEYYENITNGMVGQVLRKNGIVIKAQNDYSLIDYNNLSEDDISELIQLCGFKIEEFISKRGEKVWEHRRRNRKAVPGSVRYKVLSRAKGRCELCGISKEEKALEVDHIVPKNSGGADSIHNYQALCYICNANKRDTDDTDFRNLDAQYDERESSCVFCSSELKIKIENNLAKAFFDGYPVVKHHTLIIPNRHCADYFEISQAELNAMHDLAHQMKLELKKKDATITGFNVGFNSGVDAGQTINHCHMHLIPRRKGDVVNPVGGVRNVIPGKGDYTK